MKTYKLTGPAESDLDEHSAYIEQDNPIAAEKWLLKIDKIFDLISSSPMIGRERHDLADNLRSLPVGCFIVFYKPKHNHILIIRVLRGSMNIKRSHFEI